MKQMEAAYQTRSQRSANSVAHWCVRFSAVSFLSVALCCFTATMAAQIPSSDDVHISPQLQHRPLGQKNVLDSTVAHAPVIKSNVDLVLVPVSVTDGMNRLVTGLEKENFEVYEGKHRQEIRHFSSEDAPVSIGIILDMSGSMASKLERAREAVMEFCQTANPQDEFFLITFADRPQSQGGFTQSVEEIENRMVFTIPRGRTALLDAIYLGLAHMREAKYPKRSLLVISDGGDNHSRYSEREVKALLMEADTMVYTIGIYDHFFSTVEERLGPELLSDIAESSGGRAFTVENPNDMADVATKIGLELRNQYVIGYRPINSAHDGKWHKIKVKLHPPKGLTHLQLSAKSGYYATHSDDR